MTTWLMHGSTEAADMFHAVPLAIIDPFTLVETGDRRVAVISVLERDRIVGLDAGIEVLDPDDLGRDRLFAEGRDREWVENEIVLRALRELGVGAAAVPPWFPLGVADHVRAGEVELIVDPEGFKQRRRVKTPVQLEGIRRAQQAADAAMAVGARMVWDGGTTAEAVRVAMQAVCREHACDLDDDVIVAVNGQAAVGHEAGHGPIERGDTVVIDIWPRDRATRCWADMTRTFVAGGAEPPETIARWWALTREALSVTTAATRAGADGGAIYGLACDVYEAAGEPTKRAHGTDGPLDHGFFHGLGHGVGLEVHEAPNLGRTADPLVAGDVVTLEPGCYRRDVGGVRLEDLVLVTEDGCEVLTDFPYELTP